ncbi:hypothetical protein PUN28_020504 [Cardiocondyla obscurior]|uniref:Uncharacterized protein n=1 Tax=Cardiocondyla obscurior TaxID=286306 RepID=A0AAW2E4G1_9HYME
MTLLRILLSELFPQRTLESIKARRRRPDHREMVLSLLKDIEENLAEEENDVVEIPESNPILEFLEALPKPKLKSRTIYSEQKKIKKIRIRKNTKPMA